jgi:hypothetical protein
MNDDQAELPEADEPTAAVPANVKKPQDRKRKDVVFTFTGADGTIHKLPKITEDAAERVPFKFTRRLVMNPDDSMAQMAQAFALLDVVGATDEAIEALGELPTKVAVEIAGDWMGESQGSSD